MITKQQAAKLIKLARDAIVAHFARKNVKIYSELRTEFSERMGVFVTLTKDGVLRGCIGYVDAPRPLYEGVVSAALNAAFSDPRFPQLEKSELAKITIEISILSKPRIVEVRNPGEYLKKINIGKDGLLVRGTFGSGLLLPQVAVDHNWDPKTFLEQTCIKAGLPADNWLDFTNCTVLKFQGQVFAESGSEIVQRL